MRDFSDLEVSQDGKAAIPSLARKVWQRCPPQTPTGTQERQSFQQVGFAGAIRPSQNDKSPVNAPVNA
jgi:hypothetical protein